MDINQPIFEKAFVDGRYQKSQILEAIGELVQPNNLTDDDRTAIEFMVQELNDKGRKQLTLKQLLQYLANRKKQASYLNIYSLLQQNPEIGGQWDYYQKEQSKSNRRWIIGFILAGLMAGLYTLYTLGYLKTPSLAASSTKVVTIDPRVLAISVVQHSALQQMTPEQSHQFNLNYQHQLTTVVQQYVDDGYIVLNNMTLFAAGPRTDITADVLKKLKIPMASQQMLDQVSPERRYEVLKDFAQIELPDTQAQAEQSMFNQAQSQMQSGQLLEGPDGRSIDLQ